MKITDPTGAAQQDPRWVTQRLPRRPGGTASMTERRRRARSRSLWRTPAGFAAEGALLAPRSRLMRPDIIARTLRAQRAWRRTRQHVTSTAVPAPANAQPTIRGAP